MTKNEKLELWLKTVISGMVSNPNSIIIEKIEDDMGLLFNVSVHIEDRGKVIGKEGSIANALRIILRSAGRLEDVRASMKIFVPGSKFEVREEK